MTGQHPYAAVLGSRDPVEVMAATPGALAAILAAFSPERIEQPSAPGKWNVREVVAHLADVEIAWSWRLRYAYERENALMQPFAQDPWARMYGVYTLPLAQQTFGALRAWNLAFIHGLTEQDKARPVDHPELPGMTLGTILRIAAGHDLHHLSGLERHLGA